MQSSGAHSSERSLNAKIDARAEVNDNIFLTSLEHETVSGVIVTPSLSGVIRETNWETRLRARIKGYKYTDNTLNSNDQYFDLTGRYSAERNIYSLNINHDLASNLSSTSGDFGIVGRRINTKRQSVAPQYSRLLTERLAATLSYTYSDVDFLEAGNTGFTPYVTQTGFVSLAYDLTSRDKLTFSLTGVDYVSRNELVTYQLFMSRVGIDHQFSETTSADFQAGVSRRSSTNRQTQSFDFFGQPITITQEIDAKNRGLVLNAGVTTLLESGQISGRISRDNTSNSFGGLDQVDRLSLNYLEKLSDLWRYTVKARFDNYDSISSGSRNTDRKVFFFDVLVNYAFNRDWSMNASYGFRKIRRFQGENNDITSPQSNRIYVGVTYNFPSLSTF